MDAIKVRVGAKPDEFVLDLLIVASKRHGREKEGDYDECSEEPREGGLVACGHQGLS